MQCPAHCSWVAFLQALSLHTDHAESELSRVTMTENEVRVCHVQSPISALPDYSVLGCLCSLSIPWWVQACGGPGRQGKGGDG